MCEIVASHIKSKSTCHKMCIRDSLITIARWSVCEKSGVESTICEKYFAFVISEIISSVTALTMINKNSSAIVDK